MEIRPNAYAWRQVPDEIERRIEAGQHQPGMPIPAERRMAEELGVSIKTVRRAVGELRDEGVLETLPQKGTFVVDHQGG
ncbi:winged helix-turn-helix transcriptional regulator [Nonomuraea sp. K274]|uniref:Winged helix-turn-helix transcriptional regulator n=1 Tax=Nonomuraea cypriaca TaxID=1187855 RepID=A0A931AEM4_9ACTN|nr:winged helix-turn-helix domain-containing protein [Nonomuraea cypriaca]MBF8188680.1 winged helix-turn-helix transcriptional regulator [Nonomuraea cypriaca]